VRFSAGDRALYATDASNYRQVPVGVVVPRDVDDLVAAVEVCRSHDAPLLPRGAGTSLAGQCCNVAVVLDCSKHLRRIEALDPERRTARVQPGVVLDTLRSAAEAHGLTFGPDPATHGWCTLGGMIGNNACGAHSIMSGKTDANVAELEILTYDGARLKVGATPDAELDRLSAEPGRRGEIYRSLRALRDRTGDEVRARYPDIPRRVSGYNLDALLPERGFDVARALVGTEGTCAVVLEATVRLVPSPPARVLLLLGYPDVYLAADAVPAILPSGCIALEGFDDVMVEAMRRKGLHQANLPLLCEGTGWLMVEFGDDTPAMATERAHALMDRLSGTGPEPAMSLFEDPNDQRRVWAIRESGLAATVGVPGEPFTWEGWEDAAVPPDRLGGYLRDLRALADRFGYRCPLYGHFGDGCVHNRMTFDFRTAEGVTQYRAFVEAAADIVLRYGGSFSGEHGDGQSRAELLPRMFGPQLVRAFEEFKAIWDPQGRMNPGKIVHPRPLDADLRTGPAYRRPQMVTRFRLPADDGDFARATERCVGVGRCRASSGGVMCPSFRATGEERHSTRGRAHLLFEAMRGDPLAAGLREEAVKEALDLCLACKGCKSDCPAGVDVAMYKAEFLQHYYRGRARPLSSYTVGLIAWWARAASWAPRLANALAGGPILSPAVKRLAGVAPERRVPSFARETFRGWFGRRAPGSSGLPPVVLWPDTFTDHFEPRVAVAAVEVLEAAGFRVTIPSRPLCCGRPLYDQGMLGLAERFLRSCLREMGPAVADGVPVIGLEPSCVAVFRDELPNLFPDDPVARGLSSNVLTLAEFLDRNAPDLPVRALGRPAIVQTHCHQHAVMGFDADRRVLARIGLVADVLDEGCCGMAGWFGFERGDKHAVSRRVGELGVLPAMRAASSDALVLADGFSCREQIAQGTGKRPLHLADAVRLAIQTS
jgi:FAD/FMN-containing dehydrogenase/Fe-S oxidoreductase